MALHLPWSWSAMMSSGSWSSSSASAASGLNPPDRQLETFRKYDGHESLLRASRISRKSRRERSDDEKHDFRFARDAEGTGPAADCSEGGRCEDGRMARRCEDGRMEAAQPADAPANVAEF